MDGWRGRLSGTVPGVSEPGRSLKDRENRKQCVCYANQRTATACIGRLLHEQMGTIDVSEHFGPVLRQERTMAQAWILHRINERSREALSPYPMLRGGERLLVLPSPVACVTGAGSGPRRAISLLAAALGARQPYTG